MTVALLKGLTLYNRKLCDLANVLVNMFSSINFIVNNIDDIKSGDETKSEILI